MKNILFLKGAIFWISIFMVSAIFLDFKNRQEIDVQTSVRNSIIFYKLPGACMGTYKYKVVEPQTDGYALAVELRRLEFAPLDSPTTNLVMLYNPYKHAYYRDQIIKIPKDSCARLVGVCKHGFSETSQRITPLVQIMSK